MSIARGLYNKDVILMEIDKYFQTQELPSTMIDECRLFCNNIYKHYKQYNPKFVIFYDNGTCLQNIAVQKQYKHGRSSSKYILEDKERDLFLQIKNYYLDQIYIKLKKPNIGYTINLHEFESDLVPYYIISKGYLNSNLSNTLNIILSTDKDLLQCCKFNNCIQCISTYSRKESKINFNIYHKNNAIGYFYKKFNPGLGITADYVSLLLSLAGDKADNIDGIRGVGYAKAYKLILKYKLPPVIHDRFVFPDELEQHTDLIIKNYKIVNFDEQIKRVSPMGQQLIIESVTGDEH